MLKYMLIKYKKSYIIETKKDIEKSLIFKYDTLIDSTKYFGFLFKDSKERLALVKISQLKVFKDLLIDYSTLYNEYDIDNEIVSFENLKSISKIIESKFSKVITLDFKQIEDLSRLHYKPIQNIL